MPPCKLILFSICLWNIKQLDQRIYYIKLHGTCNITIWKSSYKLENQFCYLITIYILGNNIEKGSISGRVHIENKHFIFMIWYLELWEMQSQELCFDLFKDENNPWENGENKISEARNLDATKKYYSLEEGGLLLNKIVKRTGNEYQSSKRDNRITTR